MKMSMIAICAVLCVAAVAAAPGLRATANLPRNALWDSQTAAEKQAAIWSAVTSDETSWPWPDKLEVGEILFENMNVTFDYVSDVMPAGRKKLIHSEGYIMKFKFEASADSPYTGGFAGANYGIARFSFAAEPSSSGIIPASAWKFLRDGVPSGDMVAMPSLDPQPSFNFYEKVFTNHIGAPTDGGIIGKLIAWKFGEASDCIRAIGCSNVAMYNEDGTPVDGFASPFQIFLVPYLSFPDSSSNLNNWPAVFATVAPGTAVFEVRALDGPDSQPVTIGTLYSDSAIVPSFYGDTKLFFEHQRMDGPNGDLHFNPQWAQEGLNLEALCH